MKLGIIEINDKELNDGILENANKICDLNNEEFLNSYMGLVDEKFNAMDIAYYHRKIAYKLKDGSTSELVKITDAKVSSTNAGEVITFTTTNLSETYVITDQELNVEAAAPEKTPETPADKEPTKPAEKPEDTKPPVDDTEDSPQTGSTAFISTVFAVMAASALAFVLVLKKKH